MSSHSLLRLSRLGMHNDSRMCLSIGLTAGRLGATLANHVEVVDVVKNGQGKVTGVECKDLLSGCIYFIVGKFLNKNISIYV